MWGKVVNELVEGNDSCLFEAIYAASYFKVYKTVGDDGSVIAWIIPHFLEKYLWKDADVLVVLYGHAKVLFFHVHSEVAGNFVGIGDGDIYVELGIEHAHGGRSGIARLV